MNRRTSSSPTAPRPLWQPSVDLPAGRAARRRERSEMCSVMVTLIEPHGFPALPGGLLLFFRIYLFDSGNRNVTEYFRVGAPKDTGRIPSWSAGGGRQDAPPEQAPPRRRSQGVRVCSGRGPEDRSLPGALAGPARVPPVRQTLRQKLRHPDERQHLAPGQRTGNPRDPLPASPDPDRPVEAERRIHYRPGRNRRRAILPRVSQADS